MTATTIEAVKNYFGKARIADNDISDDQLVQVIADSSFQVKADNVPDKYQEYAARLWACHMLQMGISQAGSSGEGVILEQVGALKTQYKAYSGSRSEFGDRYEEAYSKLIDSLGLGSGTARFMQKGKVMTNDTTATEDVKPDATTDRTSTAVIGTTSGSDQVTTKTGSDGASSTNAGTITDTTESTTSADGTSPATPTAPVQNERVLTDDDWYNNEAFKALGFSKPRNRTDFDENWGFVPRDPNYIWVNYQMKPYETLAGKFWNEYGVRPYDIMKWSRIHDYNWQNKLVTVRLKRDLLPHND